MLTLGLPNEIIVRREYEMPEFFQRKDDLCGTLLSYSCREAAAFSEGAAPVK